MKGLTDIPGILVGHASDFEGLTGCTVILCEAGAVAGGDIRGSATGTEEWDVLSPRHVTDRIHAVVQVSAPITADEMSEFLSDRLVRYKIPRSYDFTTDVVRDDAGKVRRSALRDERS